MAIGLSQLVFLGYHQLNELICPSRIDRALANSHLLTEDDAIFPYTLAVGSNILAWHNWKKFRLENMYVVAPNFLFEYEIQMKSED